MSSLKQFLYDKSNKSEIDQYFEDQARFLLEKQKLETIDNFNGYFEFLNNEFPTPVYYDGRIYKSVSHAFQAARSQEQHIREKIVRADTIMEMYEIAAKVEDPPDWIKIRLKIMETLVRDKFRRNKELREKLRATENRNLVNSYGDASTSNLFWGIVEGKGQNQLGRILESVRSDIHQNIELEKWIFMTFNLEETKNLLPRIQLEVIKGDAKVESIKLESKSHYFLGKLAGSDVLMAHNSISRRHAALICDSSLGLCILDLGSKGGSFLNSEKIDNCFPFRLKPNDTIHFGVSTRRYKINFDYSEAERYLDRKKKDIKKQAEEMEILNNPSSNPEAKKAILGVRVNDQIFVGGLPDNIAEKDLKTFFTQFGEIKDLTVPKDRHTGKTKNFAFITYKDQKFCDIAIQNNGIAYKDKKLRIKYSEKRGDYEGNGDRRDFGNKDRGNREKHADAVKDNVDKITRDVEKRHKRYSRSPHNSRHQRKDDRRRRSRSRDKRRDNRRRSRDRSRSRSGRRSVSKSKSRSREREREKKDLKKGNDKRDKRRHKDGKDSDKSESRSPSRSKTKNKEKKKSEERSNKKEKTKKKSESKSNSNSQSSSSSSSSSEASGKGRKK